MKTLKPLKFLLIVWLFVFTSNLSAQSNNIDEINKVSQQIESIRIKTNWAKSIPKEDSIATAQGWYELMYKQLRELTDKKRNLIKLETGKNWVSLEEFEEMPIKKRNILLSDPNYIIEQ